MDLDPIRERERAASPGPWYAPGSRDEHGYRMFGCSDQWLGHVYAQTTESADAAFVAHAREDVPALLAEVDRLRAALEKIEDQVSSMIPGPVAGRVADLADILGLTQDALRGVE